MGETTKIQWTNHTFNPWRGCTKAQQPNGSLHPGCLHCYAEQDRSVKIHGIRWGKGQERKVKADSGWKEPLSWARKAAEVGERHRVFCASLADVLDPEAPQEAQARLWDIIRRTADVWPKDYDPDADLEDPREVGYPGGPIQPQRRGPGLDWLLLTKRPERWQLIPADVRPLVWLGTSISDQQTADEWVQRLLAAEVFRVRFLSVEPQVGPIDLTRIEADRGDRSVNALTGSQIWHEDDDQRTSGPRIEWVIQGGESGPKARPFDLRWARSLRDQCRAAGVAYFCKQLGKRPVSSRADDLCGRLGVRAGPVRPDAPTSFYLDLADSHGGDPAEWPADLRDCRAFPEMAR